MLSTVVLFVLTFAIFGLLLGVAEVYDSSDMGNASNSLPSEAPTLNGNVTSDATEGSTEADD
jgi:hypothetical protein